MLKSKIIILSALLPLALGSCEGIAEAVIEAPYISEMDEICSDYRSFVDLYSGNIATLLIMSEKDERHHSIKTEKDDDRVVEALLGISPVLLKRPAKTNNPELGDAPYRIICRPMTYCYSGLLDFYPGEGSSYFIDLYLCHTYSIYRKSVYSITQQEFEGIGAAFNAIFDDYASRPQSYESSSASSTSVIDESGSKEDTCLTAEEATNSTDGADQDCEMGSC